MNIKNIKDICDQLIILLNNKSNLYGDGLFDYHELGLLIRMNDKFRRLRNIYENINNISEKDKNKITLNALLDIIGYALLWIDYYYKIEEVCNYVNNELDIQS